MNKLAYLSKDQQNFVGFINLCKSLGYQDPHKASAFEEAKCNKPSSSPVWSQTRNDSWLLLGGKHVKVVPEQGLLSLSSGSKNPLSFKSHRHPCDMWMKQ